MIPTFAFFPSMVPEPPAEADPAADAGAEVPLVAGALGGVLEPLLLELEHAVRAKAAVAPIAATIAVLLRMREQPSCFF
ncbi:MAG: hypothetical protein ABI345_10130 [Jatrophihabitans sp.]